MPSAPRNFTLLTFFPSINQLVAEWMAPEFLNGEIFLYQIICNDLTFFRQIHSLEGNSSLYRSELDLLPNSEYTCTVQATNARGPSPLSVPVVGRTGQYSKSRPFVLLS